MERFPSSFVYIFLCMSNLKTDDVFGNAESSPRLSEHGQGDYHFSDVSSRKSV